MSDYSFDQYSQDLHFSYSQHTGHLNHVYSLLGALGEMGEVLLVHQTLSGDDIFKVINSYDDDKLIDCFVELFRILSCIELLKKKYRNNGEKPLEGMPKPDPEKLKEEIGGVLWYLNQMCLQNDITLEDVAKFNVDQLKERWEQNPNWLRTKTTNN